MNELLTISLGSASLLLQKMFAKFGDGLSGKTRTISISIPFYWKKIFETKSDINIIITQKKHTFSKAIDYSLRLKCVALFFFRLFKFKVEYCVIKIKLRYLYNIDFIRLCLPVIRDDCLYINYMPRIDEKKLNGDFHKNGK